jgi:SAM-dependent methyltransferase
MIWRSTPHDEIYDEQYYAVVVEPLMRRSAAVMAESMVREFQPSYVVDLGCGTGELLREFQERGVSGIGYEKSTTARGIARGKGIEALEIDLARPIDEFDVRRGDLAVSTEVAEHLPKRFADTFVDYLCRTSDTVLMTAATPGQGGTDHVNEQPNEYWIEKFHRRGFALDRETTERLRSQWHQAETATFYYSNLMIFRKA